MEGPPLTRPSPPTLMKRNGKLFKSFLLLQAYQLVEILLNDGFFSPALLPDLNDTYDMKCCSDSMLY